MAGSGQTVIPSGLSASIQPSGGSGHVRLEERTLLNHGTLTLAEGAILLSSAEIENTGTFKVNSESGGYSNQVEDWSGTTTLVNAGTVEKTTGTGTTKLGVTLENEGTLDAASGHFAFTAGTNTTLAAGSTLSGSFYLQGASVTAASFNGTHASLALSSGSLSIDSGATPTIASLTQTGGTLLGTGTLEVSEALSWSAGTVSGSGETILAPESTSSIDPGTGSAHVILEERTLINEGALTFPEGTLFMESGAQIQNTGYFDANSQTEWYANQIEDWSGIVSIENTGTFQKTTGTGTTRVGVPFNNDGSVKAQTGQLLFTDGGIPSDVATGTWTAEEGATIKLTNGTFLIGTSVDLSQVEVSGATVTREGSGAPGDTTLPSISGTARDFRALSAAHGTWSGSGSISYAYQWRRCNESGSNCTNIAGADSSEYRLTPEDIGKKVRVVVTASDSEGSASATSAGTSVVAPGTRAAGLSEPEQSLVIQPEGESIVSADLDLTEWSPVFFIQSLPKSMTIAPVTLGDFARASGCGSDPSVELEIYEYPAGGDLSDGRVVATSTAPQPFTSALGAATWVVPPTELVDGDAYGFFVKATGGSCTTASERSWPHDGSHVDGGPTACAALPGESTDVWRLWHTSGLADSGACDSLTSITGFETSLPSGWEEVDKEGSTASVNTTHEHCASDDGAIEEAAGGSSIVCQFPQFSEPGVSVLDGWYYGLPWNGPGSEGSPRDLYLGLDGAPTPSGENSSVSAVETRRRH